ncbi:phosphotransferase [Arthrobacter sp.]|uniref:phosphotransferase n=3 Tax=Arthrobacter sp. TaxID=1667 RepID=UPI0028126EB5|nr:phosphotransferase [Arthrobacter sp.]
MSRVRTPLDPRLNSLELLFDPDSLSTLFGRPVKVNHLRWKRATSAVARLHDDDGVRWLALYATDTSVKLEKTFRRALTHNLDLERFVLDDGVLASGPVPLDPRLYATLRPFRRAAPSPLWPRVQVLKYNPFRRVVFGLTVSGGLRLVGRAGSSTPSVTRGMLSELAAGGVPVLVPVDPADLPSQLPSGRHVEYLPWYGNGDLSSLPHEDGEQAARQAGAALALLHAQPPIHATLSWRAPAGRLRSLVRENTVLMPENHDRLARVQAQLEQLLRRPGRAAVIHGDFSADQVLVDGKSVRLIDFERCSYGAAASDLGSFAAVEALGAQQVDRRTILTLPRTAALLDGYGVGPTTVNESEVLGWTCFYLLNRLREPFRACSPDWHAQLEHRLEMIEEVLW